MLQKKCAIFLHAYGRVNVSIIEMYVSHTEAGYSSVSIPSLIKDKEVGVLVTYIVTSRQKGNRGKIRINAGNSVGE